MIATSNAVRRRQRASALPLIPTEDILVCKTVLAILLLLAGIAAGQTKPARAAKLAPETPHLQFVQEYVRELIEDEDLKVKAEKELGEAQSLNEKISAGIYFSKSTQLALRTQIAILKKIHLNGHFDVLIPSLIAFNERQIELHQKMIDMSGKFLA
jgi:hypothetical protein